MELETAFPEPPEEHAAVLLQAPPPDDQLAQALLEETRLFGEHVLPGVPLS